MPACFGGKKLLPVLFVATTFACGGSNSSSADPETAAAESTQATPATPPHELDVGMTFEDKDEPVERTDHTPPPTQTWKPVEKAGASPGKDGK